MLRRDTVPHSVIASVRGSIGAFLIYNLIFGFALPSIDMAAHLGGFVAGFICGNICSQPLADNMFAGRAWRNMVLFVGSLACLMITVYVLPDAPPDVRQELKQYSALERKALRDLDNLLREAEQGIPDDVLADRLESDICPLWEECRKRISTALRAPSSNEKFLQQLQKYADLRLQSCITLIAGLREQDQKKVQQFYRLSQSANELAKQISIDR